MCALFSIVHIHRKDSLRTSMKPSGRMSAGIRSCRFETILILVTRHFYGSKEIIERTQEVYNKSINKLGRSRLSVCARVKVEMLRSFVPFLSSWMMTVTKNKRNSVHVLCFVFHLCTRCLVESWNGLVLLELARIDKTITIGLENPSVHRSRACSLDSCANTDAPSIRTDNC